MSIEIIKANYLNEKHAEEIAFLMDSYATDPMGGRKSLTEEVKNNIAKELSKLPYAFSIISYVDGIAAGLVNCFEQFSTFSCKPLINIHDIIVLKRMFPTSISHFLILSIR